MRCYRKECKARIIKAYYTEKHNKEFIFSCEEHKPLGWKVKK